MEFAALLIKILARAIKIAMPAALQNKYEPDSDFGNYCGAALLVIILAIVIAAIRLGHYMSASNFSFNRDALKRALYVRR